MTRYSLAALGILALLALTFVCAFSRRSSIQSDLVGRSTAGLAVAGIDWADVSASGRDLTLGGLAPNDAARAEALRLVRQVGGVRVVRDELEVSPPGAGIELIASLAGGSLRLEGRVPDAAARQRLMDRAAALVGRERVIDALEIRPGAPDPDWAAAADGALAELGALQQGEIQLLDRRLTIRGRAEAEEVLELVRAKLTAALPAPYTVETELVYPELEPVDATTCQRLFDELIRDDRVEFASNSAAIDPGSVALLDEIARTAARCPQARVEIAGHTDASGPARFNLTLSQRRAEAVRQYLIESGVAAEGLRARGYGESQPIADNSTPSGRARNRRIEFKVQ